MSPSRTSAETARVQIGVAQELEGTAVELIRTRFGHHGHQTAAVISVLGLEVGRQDSEFANGIEVRHHSRTVIHGVVSNPSVYRETVGRFALPADRNIALFGTPKVMPKPLVTVDCTGTTPDCRPSRSVKDRPLSGIRSIVVPLITSPSCVLAVSHQP